MLLDTAGLLAFFDRNDVQHNNADIYFQAASRRLTHSYVLAEFVALAEARGYARAPALAFVAALQDNPQVEVVYVDEALHRESLILLQQRIDKAWSLCDAVSIVLMQRRGLTEALTTDQHFVQAGFRALLRP
jgi:predicted nucleic acid-binding protein